MGFKIVRQEEIMDLEYKVLDLEAQIRRRKEEIERLKEAHEIEIKRLKKQIAQMEKPMKPYEIIGLTSQKVYQIMSVGVTYEGYHNQPTFRDQRNEIVLQLDEPINFRLVVDENERK
jgi:hypothetical protein